MNNPEVGVVRRTDIVSTARRSGEQRHSETRSPADAGSDFPGWPEITDDDVDAVQRVLRTGHLSQAVNATVTEFEDAIAEYQGTDHAIAVSSGTAALHLVLAALGVGAGAEVVVPSHTFVGSASPIVYLGGTPVFADVDAGTYCMSVDDVARCVTERTRVIVVVHLNGCPADPEIYAFAAERGIAVVDDAAQALGARMFGEPVGSRGSAAILSFFEQKVITCGEGGMILTSDPDVASRVRLLRSHGEGPVAGAPGKLWAHEIGFNYRMTALQAALGRSQLRRLESLVDKRRENADILRAALSAIPWLELPVEPPNGLHSYWRFVVRIKPDQLGCDAQHVVTSLNEAGIPATLRYPYPVHAQPAFVNLGITASCPVSDRLSRELVSLPVHPGLTPTHLQRIAAAVETL